ncbi:hypothetical protein [Microbacterium sp.]|uniref:hypothetical protein n=1 Tax=Microbacterium sp. TaxID=51671 RepID=UPI0028123B38|nr:hypothetical protein [Microbacterium sp.]
MTSATLHLTAPTALERGLQHIADAISHYVARRIAARAERREITLDMLREQQTRRHDPQALDTALLALGSRPR